MIFRLLLILLTPLVIQTQIIYGQQQEDVIIKGEILVQLKSKTSIHNLLSAYQAADLKKIHTVSERFNIYLLNFDESRANTNDLLRSLKTDRNVIHAQNNHMVSTREINEVFPNDPLFGEQWALYNTGEGNAKEDADIDATDSWETNTGGVTSDGDTIVLAIIDSGSDVNHEDINFWINTNEIRNNGVDDDQNGYIDDYYGWNAYDYNGDVPLSNHGIHVAGIAAAIGDNDIGVSGVNWNAKIMAVAGSSTTEATVVEALSYVYVQRENYDLTNGEAGAFVVADNCSFGVNYGQPEDFPIWEAMYDSLGLLGVMSIGATTNRNDDVDEVGDIPTAFSTPYLISVTNTNNQDEKNTAAGYGDSTIHLGAPGTRIMSCLITNNYGYKSGTSMAAPQVTGAVGLLISAGDEDFIEDYRNNPSEAIQLVRQYIFDGVDTLETLLGKTTTGGRLNVNNSLQVLLNAPQIGLSKDSVVTELPEESETDETILIVNVGGDTLFYEISFEDEPEWLTLSQYEGALKTNNAEELTLYFNSAGLPEGEYETEMIIDAEDAVSHTLPVKMYVSKGIGIEDMTATPDVKVYPNPFKHIVHFEIADGSDQSYIIEIYDQLGKQVYSGSSLSNGSVNSFDWESSNSGIYFYKLLSEGVQIKSGKIINY